MMTKVLDDLPPIPDKLYFTIGETADLCAVKPHVLRYWEQEFQQLRPTKRRGGRRYYQRKDVELIREIRYLLYVKGYTILGAKQQIQTGKLLSIVTTEESPVLAEPLSVVPKIETIAEKTKNTDFAARHAIRDIVAELQSLLEAIKA